MRFIKVNYSFDLPRSLDIGLTGKDGFCTLIVGNKRFDYPQELYTQRIEAIRWFVMHYPDKFDLCGTGGMSPLSAKNALVQIEPVLYAQTPHDSALPHLVGQDWK